MSRATPGAGLSRCPGGKIARLSSLAECEAPESLSCFHGASRRADPGRPGRTPAWLAANIIHPERGSWLFLAVLLSPTSNGSTSLEADRCGTCTRDASSVCPDVAIVAPYQLTRGSAHLVPDDRAAIPPRAQAPDRQPHLRLRRLPRGLPLEPFQSADGGGEFLSAGGGAQPALGFVPRFGRKGLQGKIRRLGDPTRQAPRLYAQRLRRDRQQRKARDGGGLGSGAP